LVPQFQSCLTLNQGRNNRIFLVGGDKLVINMANLGPKMLVTSLVIALLNVTRLKPPIQVVNRQCTSVT